MKASLQRWLMPWRWGWRELRIAAEVWLLAYFIAFAVIDRLPITSPFLSMVKRIVFRPVFWIF